MAFAGFSNFITQLREISVFDESTYKKATDNNTGPFKILIEPNAKRTGTNSPDVGVKGIIQGPQGISFTIEANWDTLGLENIFSSLVSQNSILQAVAGAAQTVMGVAGTSLSNSGLVTRKFYTQSGYLSFNVNFRVLDWDDDGMPVKAAQIMIGLCVPRKTNGTSVKDMLNSLPKDSGINQIINTAQEGIQSLSTNQNIPLAQDIAAVGSGAATQLNEGEINVTQAPAPVRVVIGHWFEAENCVITNVQVDFSQEMTIAGPLYADFNVSISTRDTIIIDENGVQGIRIGARESNRVNISTGTLETF